MDALLVDVGRLMLLELYHGRWWKASGLTDVTGIISWTSFGGRLPDCCYWNYIMDALLVEG